ncbi:MAG: carbamoyltransferase HypF [Bryobacteraceae bacterium]
MWDLPQLRVAGQQGIGYRWCLRRRLFVQGIVQGVGFRPWVHQLARTHGLTGYVLNSTEGVTIEIEGPEGAQQGFLADFRNHPPPLAEINDVREDALEPVGYQGFVIRESAPAVGAFVLIPPDVATCAECMADFRDPANRRYGYPFTNCTHCGPRYTIIQDIPYDRRFTTMSEFPMCAECHAEYSDPTSRRFHAQPNACPVCGPWVELWDHKEKLAAQGDAIARTKRLLAGGSIVAIKGLGGFHLACVASSDAAVDLLRERKRRSEKPFAIMVRDLETVERLCDVTNADRAALTSIHRPIVLLQGRGSDGISLRVAPGIRQVGVMLPYTPLHHLLFDGAEFDALVMTSGNLSEEPIVCKNEEVASRLYPLADLFLLHNRRIQTRVDDSVVRTFEGREIPLRRSRGYAPQPVNLGIPVEQVLACGGELKNVLCVTKEHYAVLSQDIGDLENLETLHVFEETLEHMKRFFRVNPVAVAHDLHPQYLSTRFALALDGVEKIGVQHHHAHIGACMAENHLDGSVMGVALDGTGFGTDGKIWGGEFLVCDYTQFERHYHFRYVPLAGGDTGVRQLWRSGLAYAQDAGLSLDFAVDSKALGVVQKMIAQGVNTIETSSCGRLFDAVASILGLRMEANYEGQGAMELEALSATQQDTSAYPFDFDADTVDLRETIRALARDLHEPKLAGRRFHNTIAGVVNEVCLRLRAQTGLQRVCLSGGTFQNMLLLGRTVEVLRRSGFEVFFHTQVPPNDGGLCLGQAAIANGLLRIRKSGA